MWPAEWVVKRYFSLNGAYNQTIDRLSASKRWAVDKNYASVALHEMRRVLLVDRVGRGKHLLVAPERWVRVHSFLARAPNVSEDLAELLRDSTSEVESLVLYGSRAWGGADELSDWDFLVIVRSEETKEHMVSKLPEIEQRNPRFDAEVLSLPDFERFLRKNPIFLKIVEHGGEPIIDFGAMGIVKVARVTPRHMAVELLAAKESILHGIAAAREDKRDIACYLLVRGARRTIAAKLAARGNFSGKMLEEEFAECFSEFSELRVACKKVRAKQRADVSKETLKKLIKKAVIEWEKTSLELREFGKAA